MGKAIGEMAPDSMAARAGHPYDRRGPHPDHAPGVQPAPVRGADRRRAVPAGPGGHPARGDGRLVRALRSRAWSGVVLGVVVLAAVLDTPYGPLTVAATHLSFVPGWNLLQLRRVVRALRALPAPRILLGDLNLPAGPAALLTRWRPLGRRPTYPAGQPRVQLDHILADRHDLDRLPPVTAVATPLSTISDHRPLIVDLGPHS